MEANGQDFIEFWDYAANKGLVKKDWAGTLRTAVKQVLASVEPETWQKLDLNDLDVDSFIQRFERLRMGDLKPDSLAVYGKRFRIALMAYLDFLKSPSTWQYSSGRPESPGAEPRKTVRQPSKRRPAAGSRARHEPEDPDGDPRLVPYPYPLRQGLMVTLNLPTDLTKFEAKRLAAFVDSLALDQQPALLPGDAS